MATSRSFPARPVLGVGAVILDGDRVVLVKRAHEPLKGRWSLPGGAVEVGETLEAALIREVAEETGLEIRVGPVVEVLDRIHLTEDRRVEFHFVIVDYLCRVKRNAGGGGLAAGSDADDVRWVSAADLDQYALTDPAIAVIRKARTMSSSGYLP
jgi:mutator protein MutT